MTTLDIHLDDTDMARELRSDVRTGLTAAPKWLPPKWFYDARGSRLFEDITRLPSTTRPARNGSSSSGTPPTWPG